MTVARDRWSGNTAFILASIGSAIGLGNLWRFPFKCYDYGGGAFLVAYLFALVTAGIPLLAMEFSLGNMTQRGAPGAFRKVRRGLEWMGWWPILIGFVLTSYYVVVMGWCVDYFWFAAKGSCFADPAGFWGKFLDRSDPAKLGTLNLGGIRWPLLVGMLISWVMIVLAIWKGATTVSKVVWLTVMVPWALLLLFTVQALRMEGAGEGLKLYLVPKWRELLNPQLWVAAYGQVFYSLSVGFGIMIAYSSFMPRRSNLVRDALVIGIADSLTAIVAGFAVFGALGHLAHTQGVAVNAVVQRGPGLVFKVYPAIIGSLPAARLFGALFFLMLITLAVDSAFSLTEAVCAGVRDKWGLSHKTANFTVAGAGILVGLVFCTRSGIFWLDIVDKYLEYFGLGAACLAEVVLLSIFLKTGTMRRYLNSAGGMKLGPWWDVCVMAVTPLMLAAVIGVATWDLIKKPYEGYPSTALWIGGWGLFLALPLLAWWISGFRGSGDDDAELSAEDLGREAEGRAADPAPAGSAGPD